MKCISVKDDPDVFYCAVCCIHVESYLAEAAATKVLSRYAKQMLQEGTLEVARIEGRSLDSSSVKDDSHKLFIVEVFIEY